MCNTHRRNYLSSMHDTLFGMTKERGEWSCWGIISPHSCCKRRNRIASEIHPRPWKDKERRTVKKLRRRKTETPLSMMATMFRPGARTPITSSQLHLLYCIVSIHLYSASCSAHQPEALPVRETQREESSGQLVEISDVSAFLS